MTTSTVTAAGLRAIRSIRPIRKTLAITKTGTPGIGAGIAVAISLINAAATVLSDLERLGIRAGISWPADGSLLLVGDRS